MTGLDHDHVRAAFDAEIDPWPVWRALAAEGPVVASGPMYLVTTHADCKRVLTDTEAFSNNSRRRGTRLEKIRATLTPERWEAFEEIARFHALFMVASDGEVHRRLRSVARRAFVPRRIALLEQELHAGVDEAIGALASHEDGDLVDLVSCAASSL